MILRQTVPRATCEHTHPGSRPLDNHSNKCWSYQIASWGKWDVADGPAALEQKLMVSWGQEGDPLGPSPCLGSSFPGPILQLTCINYQTDFICMVFFAFQANHPWATLTCQLPQGLRTVLWKWQMSGRREAGEQLFSVSAASWHYPEMWYFWIMVVAFELVWCASRLGKGITP